jgi:nucleoredoxin
MRAFLFVFTMDPYFFVNNKYSTPRTQGIPTLVVLDPQGKLVTDNGTSAVQADPEGSEFPWAPKQIQELTGDSLSLLNKSAFVIAFTDGSDGEAIRVRELLAKLVAADPAKFADIKFFFSHQDDEAVDSLRGFAHFKPEHTLVALDIPNQAKFLAESHAPLTEATVGAFLDAFVAKKLPKKGLRED